MSKNLDELTEATYPRGRIRIKKGGKVVTILSDTQYYRNGDNLEMKYDTSVNGRVFHVTTVLPACPASTPSQKIQSLIDICSESSSKTLDFYQNPGYNNSTVQACPIENGGKK